MKKINGYLIWDFDGTLGWRPKGWTGALLAVLQQNVPQMDVTAEQIRPYLQSGFPWHAPENAHPGLTAQAWWEDIEPVFFRAFRSLGIENGLSAALATKVREVYIDPVLWQLYPDTLPALQALAEQGWKHLLLSNHVPEMPVLLEQLGLASHFSAIFNSAETGYEKPNPRAFRSVLAWIEPAASAWVIGDSYTADFLGAYEVGLQAVLVRKPHPEAACYCESLADILPIISRSSRY